MATGARSFHQSVQAGYEAQPASYSETSRRTFPRLKGPARKVNDSPVGVEDKNAGNFATTLLEAIFFEGVGEGVKGLTFFFFLCLLNLHHLDS